MSDEKSAQPQAAILAPALPDWLDISESIALSSIDSPEFADLMGAHAAAPSMDTAWAVLKYADKRLHEIIARRFALAAPAPTGASQSAEVPALSTEDVIELLKYELIIDSGAGFLRSGSSMSFDLDELTLFANHVRKTAAIVTPPAAMPAQASVVPVDVFFAEDGVEGRHHEYGRGTFFTDNCMKSVVLSAPTPPEPAPAIQAQLLTDAARLDWLDSEDFVALNCYIAVYDDRGQPLEPERKFYVIERESDGMSVEGATAREAIDVARGAGQTGEVA